MRRVVELGDQGSTHSILTSPVYLQLSSQPGLYANDQPLRRSLPHIPLNPRRKLVRRWSCIGLKRQCLPPHPSLHSSNCFSGKSRTHLVPVNGRDDCFGIGLAACLSDCQLLIEATKTGYDCVGPSRPSRSNAFHSGARWGHFPGLTKSCLKVAAGLREDPVKHGLQSGAVPRLKLVVPTEFCGAVFSRKVNPDGDWGGRPQKLLPRPLRCPFLAPFLFQTGELSLQLTHSSSQSLLLSLHFLELVSVFSLLVQLLLECLL